jgi:hypothetical protein
MGVQIMALYAVVESGTVTNMIEWDGSTPHTDSAKFILSDANAWIGGTHNGSSFSARPAVSDIRTYAQKREDSYPTIGDQLDMLWHAIDGDTILKSNYADFHTAIKAVKDANPKP